MLLNKTRGWWSWGDQESGARVSPSEAMSRDAERGHGALYPPHPNTLVDAWLRTVSENAFSRFELAGFTACDLPHPLSR